MVGREKSPFRAPPRSHAGLRRDIQTELTEGMGRDGAIIAFGRYDWPDLLFPGGGQFSGERDFKPWSPALYRNMGASTLISCSGTARLSVTTHYSQRTAVGDFDDDDLEDALIKGDREATAAQPRDCTFVDTTATAGPGNFASS